MLLCQGQNDVASPIGKCIRLTLFFTLKNRENLLTWDFYAHSLKEQFGFSSFRYPMAKLVSLMQHGPVNQFHDEFVSLLNQLQLFEAYDLSIFTSKLKLKIGQYM